MGKQERSQTALADEGLIPAQRETLARFDCDDQFQQ